MTVSTHTGEQPLTDYATHLQARHLSPATIRTYVGWPRRLSETGPLLTLTPAQIEAWLADQHWQPATHAKAVSAIRLFYRWAHHTGLIDTDPAAALRPARVPRGVPQPCPEHLWRKAIDHASGDTYWRLRLAGDTGLRRSELAHVHSGDVTELPSGPALRVQGKGGKTRCVPIPADLAQWVSLQHGFVFGGMSAGGVGKWFTRHVGVHPHTLRHRYASRAYAGSHDIEAVRDLLGHASVATTQGYVAIAGDDLAHAARAAWTAA